MITSITPAPKSKSTIAATTFLITFTVALYTKQVQYTSFFPAQKAASKAISPPNSGKPGYWNSYEIRVQGNEIEVKLNNQLISAGTFPELLGFADPSNGKKEAFRRFHWLAVPYRGRSVPQHSD
jgi:hypothetical protein